MSPLSIAAMTGGVGEQERSNVSRPPAPPAARRSAASVPPHYLALGGVLDAPGRLGSKPPWIENW